MLANRQKVMHIYSDSTTSPCSRPLVIIGTSPSASSSLCSLQIYLACILLFGACYKWGKADGVYIKHRSNSPVVLYLHSKARLVTFINYTTYYQGYDVPSTMPTPSWSRLIRFIPTGSTIPIYGEPVAHSYTDIGALADAGELSARVILVDSDGPLSPSARVTDEILRVAKLLGPLDAQSCTDIKCIGLNYKKHSESAYRFSC
jgi:hypothetical protein